jgi:UDP-glucose 4-epimerase
MNVLVTGGAGFIGSHVADELLAAGHHVVIVDNLHTGRRENVPPGAVFYEADIRDEKALAEIFEKEQIEAISHQAALANVRESMADPLTYAQTNILGTLNLLELARKHNCQKIIFASTGGAVYGEGFSEDGSKLPFTEQSWPQPKDNYGLKYVALRYPNVYGPRQDSKGEAGVVAIFAGAMLEGRPTRITGDGKQQRDFTYVGDIARANRLALESDASGIFNVGTGVPTDINTIHEILAEITHYTLKAEYVPRPLGEVRATYLNSDKARQVLGWEPTVSLIEGLRKVVEWMRSEHR